MKKTLILFLSIFVVSNLNAQTVREFINRIHTQLLTGVSLKTVKGQMAAYQIIDSAGDESGDKILVYRVSDKYEVSYWFGSDNRVSVIGLNVYCNVFKEDIACNGFELYDFSDVYGPFLQYKNILSKTILTMHNTFKNPGYAFAISKDSGFKYMTVDEYNTLLRAEMEREYGKTYESRKTGVEKKLTAVEKEQALKDSIHRREVIDSCLYKCRTSGVPMDASVKNEFYKYFATQLRKRFLKRYVGHDVSVKFDDKIVITESGSVIHEIKYDKSSTVDGVEANEWRKELQKAMWVEYVPQHIDVLDTTIVTKSYGMISMSCGHESRVLKKLRYRDDVFEYKGVDGDFYNRYSEYLNDYVEKLGNGIYDLYVYVLYVSDDYEYYVDVLKSKPIKTNLSVAYKNL